ncbi:MAG TPA: hypothetical protein VF085_11260 [Solirubrobacterales bacterium]
MQRRLPWIVGTIGAAVFAAGVAVLFTTDQSARSAFLLTLGVALGLAALFGGRIQLEGFEMLGAKIRVREVVKSRLELAESPGGDPAVGGAAPHRQAVVLQKLVGFYGLYEHIRRTEPPGRRRTAELDELTIAMRAVGRDAEFDPAEVIGWFHEGTDALRVIALNLMLANKDYRDFLAVLETVDAPHSLFEQFYGLLLAETMLPDLDPLQGRLLGAALERARKKPRFRRDGPLMDRSQTLLDQLRERA